MRLWLELWITERVSTLACLRAPARLVINITSAAAVGWLLFDGQRIGHKIGMDITGGQRRTGPKRIGELLVAANVIKPEVLGEALQISKMSSTPLGRVLMSIGELTERDLQTAIEVQSLLRDGTISTEFGIKALHVAVRGRLSVEEAFARLGWKAPELETMPGSELGELLSEAGIVDPAILNQSVQQSKENNLPLGRCLVLGRVIPASLLTSALTAQVLLRDGKITREQAIIALKAAARKHQTIEASLEEVGAYRPSQSNIRVGDLLASAGLVSESDKISAIERGLVENRPFGQVLVQAGTINNAQLQDSLRLQEMVLAGNLTGEQAAEILRTANARRVPIEIVLGEYNQKEKEVVETNALLALLQDAGILTKEKMFGAENAARQMKVTVGEALLATNLIDKLTLSAAREAQEVLKNGMMQPEQVRAVLRYAHKNGLNFTDAARADLGAVPEESVGKKPQSDGWLGKLWSKVKKPE